MEKSPQKASWGAAMVWLIPDLVSSVEADALVDLAEDSGFNLTELDPPFIAERRLRVMVDSADWARRLSDRLLSTLPKIGAFYTPPLEPGEPRKQVFDNWTAAAVNPRFRFYRYRPGDRFAPHVDHEFAKSADYRTFLSLVLYLNDTFTGGETRFPDSEIRPRKGLALVYPHELFHEGGIVFSGSKTILRSDVFYSVEST